MNKEFIPNGEYLNVLMGLGCWKILDANKILSTGIVKVKYKDLMKKLTKLEKVGLVNSFRKGNAVKHFYLTDQGKKYSGKISGCGIDADYLNHESATSRVMWELLKNSELQNGDGLYYDEIKSVDPDAVILGKINNQDYKLAIEVELTQKSSKRVVEKFNRYKQQSLFDYTVYVTQSRTLFNAYKKILDSLCKRVQKQIILILEENLIEGKINFNKSVCFYMNNKVNFTKLLKLESGDFEANLRRECGE